MIIGVGSIKNDKAKLNIGTHGGIFHCDEVVGIAILGIVFENATVYVVRTRDLVELKKLNVVIDIGKGEFDHHIEGFNLCRDSGEKYASAGLVWNKFGVKAIEAIANKENLSISEEYIKKLKKEIDREVIIPVDMEDNGEKFTNHLFSFIPKFLPAWTENQDYDAEFYNVQNVVTEILKRIIKDKIIQIVTKNELENRYDQVFDGILEIPNQTMPWLEEVVDFNKKHNNKVKFVIFPYPAGGWAAQCVPPSLEEKFKQLISFPKQWAGKDEESLPKISEIEDAILCHNGCFFVRAKTKESIIKMCKIATTTQ